MELYRELLLQYLLNSPCEVRFPGLNFNAAEIINSQCYQALKQIKKVLEDDHLSDPECFEKIERIIRILEQNGISCGVRHDFY